mgnify:CR=1 FL=1
MFLIILVLSGLLAVNVPVLNRLTFANHYVGKFDNLAISYIDNSINKCLITFVSVRGLNAIISVLKSSTVNLTPAGVGAALSIGEILDPVDDMIETLSDIVLFSIVSLGVQRFIIEIVPFVSVNIFFNLFLVSCFILLLLKRLQKKFFINITLKFLILALIIRFVLPSFVFINWVVDKTVFNKEYESSKNVLRDTNEKLTSTYGVIFSGKNIIDGFRQLLKKEDNSKNWLESLKNSAEDIIKSSIRLIVVFIIDLFLLPLFFLWLLYKFLSGVFFIRLFTKKLNL